MTADPQITARLLQDYEYALRNQLANLLRVSRGAGRPHDIPGDAFAILRAVEAYHAHCGYGPTAHEVAKAVALPSSTVTDPFWDAEMRMVEGAMQVAASELLGQRSQASAGRTQLHEGWQMKLNAIKAQGTRL